MTLKRISGHCWFTDPEPASDRPALGYIRGEKYAFAVDAGASKRHTEAFYAVLAENGLPLPSFTGITHYHWDHSYGMAACRGVTIATKMTNDILREEALYKWDEASMQERLRSGKDIRFCHVTRKTEYPDLSEIRVVPADMEITAETTVDLGGVQVRLIPCKGPHSLDSMLFFVPEDRVIYLGDAEAKDFFLNSWDYDENDPDSFDRAIEAMPHFTDRLIPFVKLLRGMDFDTVILGHSDETVSKNDIIDELERYIK